MTATIRKDLPAKVQAVLSVSNLVSMSLSLEDILQKSVDVVVDKLNYESSVIFINDPQNHRIHSKTFTNKAINSVTTKLVGNNFDSLFIDYEKSDNFIVQSVTQKKVIVDSHLENFISPVVSSTLAKVLQKLSFTGNIISLPILYREQCLGAIMFTKSSPESFDDDLDVLNIYSQQIAIAINNAESFNDKQNQVLQLENKNQELESLYTLTNNISQTLDPLSVAQSAVNSLPQDDTMFGAFLNFYDNVQGDIYMKALTKNPISDQIMQLVGNTDSYKSNVNKPEDQVNPIVIAVKTGKMQVANNLADLMSPPMPKALALTIAKLMPISSALIYPLKSRNETVGSITLLLKGKKYEELDDSKKQLYSTYALQIGIALENANLFTNLGTALEQLKEARRRERDMLDVMGHELRTPISIVRNALLMLDRDYTKTDGAITKETLRRYLDMAIESVRREITLIETLLSATKIDASRMQLFLSKVDFKDVVNDGIEGQRVMIQQKGLQLIYNPPAGEVSTYADRTRTQEIMDNFLSNSAKYTNTGSITIDTWQDNDSGWIRIKDTGMGISEEDLQNLGKKFFRAKQYIPTKDAAVGEFIRPGGTGLGLYVTFDLIRIMGGKLYINSKVGEGSSFTFSLPVYKNQPDNQIDETFSSDSTAKKEHVILNGDAPQPPQA